MPGEVRCISEVGGHLTKVGLSETVVLSPSCPLGSLKSLLEILMPGPTPRDCHFIGLGGSLDIRMFLKIPGGSNGQLGLRTSDSGAKEVVIQPKLRYIIMGMS